MLVYWERMLWSLLSAWFIEWTWTHSPASLGSGQMSKLFGVLKKSVSICPAIAAPLCINFCTFLGAHGWIGISCMTILTSRLDSQALSQWSRTALIGDTCTKICYGLGCWKHVLVCGSKSDQIQTWSEYWPAILHPPS